MKLTLLSSFIAISVFATSASAGVVDFATSSSINPGSNLSGSADFVGTAFQVGGSPIEVTHLGAFDSAFFRVGTSVAASLFDGSGTLLATAPVALSFSGSYVYTPITPVVLPAGGDYFIAASGVYRSGGNVTSLSTEGLTAIEDRIYQSRNPMIDLPNSVFVAGTFSSGSFQYTVVPEPETYAMIAGLGLVGFGVWRRRRAN